MQQMIGCHFFCALSWPRRLVAQDMPSLGVKRTFESYRGHYALARPIGWAHSVRLCAIAPMNVGYRFESEQGHLGDVAQLEEHRKYDPLRFLCAIAPTAMGYRLNPVVGGSSPPIPTTISRAE